MPPKTVKKVNGEVSSEGGKIVTMCHLIMSCENFKGDNAFLAPILGIAQATNVPRKINSIVAPYGFEYKAGKIVKNGEGSPSPAKSAEGEEDIETTPVPKKKAKKAGHAAKKRKLDEVPSTEEFDSDAGDV